MTTITVIMATPIITIITTTVTTIITIYNGNASLAALEAGGILRSLPAAAGSGIAGTLDSATDRAKL